MDRLPVELFWRIFSYGDRFDILVARNVSRLWRAAATSHEYFWGQVDVTSTRSKPLRWAQTRLAATGTRCFALRIIIRTETRSMRLHRLGLTLPRWESDAAALVALLTSSLPRLHKLEIDVDYGYWRVLMPCLICPAPLLQDLKLAVDKRVASGIRTPRDLLVGHSSTLRKVDLDDNMFPLAPVSAFACVQELSLRGTYTVPLPSNILQHFPQVRTLHIAGYWRTGAVPAFAEAPTILPQLDVLILSLSEQHLRDIIPDILLLDNLPSLHIWYPRSEIMNLVLQSFDTPLAASFALDARPDSSFYDMYLGIRAHSAGRGKNRNTKMLFAIKDPLGPAAPNVRRTFPFKQLSPEFTRGIISMTVRSSACEVMVKDLPVLEDVAELSISADGEELLPQLCAQFDLLFPSLRQIKLQVGEEWLSFSNTAALASHLVGHTLEPRVTAGKSSFLARMKAEKGLKVLGKLFAI